MEVCWKDMDCVWYTIVTSPGITETKYILRYPFKKSSEFHEIFVSHCITENLTGKEQKVCM